MATTLTDSGEITQVPEVSFSFPIEKTETTADGDLMVYGKASDGSVDADQQIVDPKWMAKAIKEWFASGPNLRVQHNAQRDPAGVGVDWNSDDSGGTWVKSVVGEPVAKKLLSMGALRAYSVGIARPTIERDVTGKARGGIITDGVLVEISLVDRPANKSCGIQLVKSAGDGTAEYVGEVFGDDEVIAKFTEAQVAKSIEGGHEEFNVSTPNDMTLDFTPNDLMKILQNKLVERHYDDLALKAIYDAEDEVYKRNVSTAERRSLASQNHALPDGSYPIANAGDLHNAAHLAATGHGNAEGAKKLIARRAKELGVANPLDSDESKTERGSVDNATAEIIKTDDTVEPAVKEAEPVVTKDPEETPEPEAEKAKKPAKGKKMPPWLKPKDGDSDDSSCKEEHAHTEKCTPSGTPKSTSGAADAADMKEIPNTGPAPESPMPAGRKNASPETSAMLRFKSIGIDTDLGRLHDLTCPAYHPEDVSKYHPFADFVTVIDEDIWQRKALDAATGKSYSDAMAMQQVWQAAATLKHADLADLNDYRLELHKAFRDANPGVASYPSPGSISPGKFNRPVLGGGHAANSPGYGSPNSSPDVASGPVSGAGSFNRPPLGSGQQSPSPSFMKNEFEVPPETGRPMHLNYAHIEKDKSRMALIEMHQHLSRQFPEVCPMDRENSRPLRGTQPENKPLPSITGIGKAVEPEQTEAAVSKSPGEVPQDVLDSIEKGLRKKLGKKVLSGAMTVDEARAKMGRMRSQKMLEWQTEQQLAKGDITREDALKALGFEPDAEVTVSKGVSYQGDLIKDETPEVAKGIDPDIIKSAIAEALAPLVAKVEQQQEIIKAQEKRWEDAANLPDPSTAGFAGFALNPVRKSQPAAVTKTAEIAEQTQRMIARQLQRTARLSENPAEREAAWAELSKYGNVAE